MPRIEKGMATLEWGLSPIGHFACSLCKSARRAGFV